MDGAYRLMATVPESTVFITGAAEAHHLHSRHAADQRHVQPIRGCHRAQERLIDNQYRIPSFPLIYRIPLSIHSPIDLPPLSVFYEFRSFLPSCSLVFFSYSGTLDKFW